MASEETVLDRDKVHDQELHEIAERRRAAGLLAPSTFVDLVLGWVWKGLLPPEAVAQILLRLLEKPAFTTADGGVDCTARIKIIQDCLDKLQKATGPAPASGEAPHLGALAQILVKQFNERWLEPDRLEKTIKCWTEVGALPPEARLLTVEVLRRLLNGSFFTRLSKALREKNVRECEEFLREHRTSGHLNLRAVERRRRDAGLELKAAPAGEKEDADIIAEFREHGDFLVGEGLTEKARRILMALKHTVGEMKDEEFKAFVKRRNERRNDRDKAFANEEHSAADRETLVLEALVLRALTHNDDLAQRTTGLALSGGGLRSASFNLGLLQALYRSGLLRGVDYLSTVSGGTYIGAWLSARIAQPDKPISRADDFSPLNDRKGGGEGCAVKRLIRAGYYLNHPLVFTSRYVFGLLTVNLVLLSFLLLGSVVVAGAWRLLDEPPVCESILVLTGGILIEAYRPFLVATVFLLAWLIGWSLAASRKSYESRARFDRQQDSGQDNLSASRKNHEPRVLYYGVSLTLLAVTAGLPLLEWHSILLWPDHPLWRFIRPLPLVLLFAWLLAWQITKPPALLGGSAQAYRFALRVARRARWHRDARRRYRQASRSVVHMLLAVFPSWLRSCLYAQACRFVRRVAVPLFMLWSLWWVVRNCLDLPYGADVGWTVALVASTVVWVGRWGLSRVLARSSGDPAPYQIAKRLQWLLLLSGASFLVGWAVWLSTPSINLVPTTSTAYTPPDQGTIEQHRSWLYPLLAGLIASLVPFLNPRRLLESGLHPKRFWEPWLFRLACVGAVIGVPLLAVYLFARHNLSGYNTVRSPEILPGEIDFATFFQRVKQDIEEECPPATSWERPLIALGLRPKPFCPLVAAWDKLYDQQDDPRLPFHGGKWTVRDIVRDDDLAKVLRQQPVPLSQQAERKKCWVVKQVNAVVFGKDTASPEDLFHTLLERQRRIEEAKGDKTGQWRSWPAIKEMLYQLKETRAVTKQDLKERQDLTKRVKRLILEADYPIDARDVPRRQNVIHWDQLVRLGCVLVLLVACGVVLRRARLNSSSLHSYYRDQLAWAYLAWGKEKPGGEPNGEQQRRLRTLDTTQNGGPYLLINATLNTRTIRQLLLRAFGKSEMPEPASPAGFTDCFVFGRDFIGSDTSHYAWTDDYEAATGVRLRDAVALSGAAVSLTQIDNPLLLLLMTALNLRLGQWLPSPRHHRGLRRLQDRQQQRHLLRWLPSPRRHQFLRPPALYQLLTDHEGDAAKRRFYFISDGGHHDNLGLSSLLKRRCQWIIVSDVTYDPAYSFDDFCRACRQARRQDGVELFPLDGPAAEAERPLDALDEVRPQACRKGDEKGGAGADGDGPQATKESKSGDRTSRAHYFLARVEYPRRSGPRPGDEEGGVAEVDIGYLIYLKPSFTGDEPVDLKGHWQASREFPHDPTSNQFYDEEMVDSYRQLGEHIGEQIAAKVRGDSGEDLWAFDARQFEQALNNFVEPPQRTPPVAEAPLASEPCATPSDRVQAVAPVGSSVSETYRGNGPGAPPGAPG